MPPLVSVIIVNWNTRDLLRACLGSLPWDSTALQVEAVVVDNGSEDGSPEMVRAEFPAVRLLCNDDNLGFVKANNQGLAAAQGDYLFMLNSDTEVHPGCLENLVEVLEQNRSYGAAGARLTNPDGSYQFSASEFPPYFLRLLPGAFEARRIEVVNRRMAAMTEPCVVDWLVGAALMMPRRVLEEVGPLDERYFMWLDDIDWGRKLHRAGYQAVHVPAALVLHRGRQSGAKVENARLISQILESEYTYWRLNFGRSATVLMYLVRWARTRFQLLRRGGTEHTTRSRTMVDYYRRNFGRLLRDEFRYGIQGPPHKQSPSSP